MATPLPSADQAIAAQRMVARASDLHRRGHLAEAEAIYLAVLRELPESFDAQNLLGVLRSQQGRVAEALALVAGALKAKPDAIGALMNQGLILHKMKRHEEALDSFDKALAVQPDHAGALNNRAIILAAMGRDHAALASYWRALTAKPDYADAHNNMGVLLKELGWLTEAEAALSKALDLNPKLTSAYINLCDCKTFSADDPHLAAMRALERDPSLTQIERMHLDFALGKAFADIKDPRRAFRHLQRANARKRTQVAYDEAAVMELFDRVEATFTSDLMRAKAGRGHETPVPIFVIGMPRSGTSLIEQIAASHHSVFGAGELTTLSDVIGSVYGPHGQIVRYPDYVPDVDGEVFEAIGAHYAAALRKLAPHARHIVDKMPANFFFAGIIHLALPNARMIHVIRDPVDTCVSCFFQMFSGELNHTYDLAELGRYYRRYQRLMAHWHRVLPPGRILDVRYEDVVADLETQARRVIAHCGLEWDPHCLRFHETDRRVRTASATQVRQAIYPGAIGRWRAYRPYLGPLLGELFPADEAGP